MVIASFKNAERCDGASGVAGWPVSPPQRDHRGSCARADQGRDVVAYAREGIAAALPSLILVAFNARAAFLLARDPTTT
jgi:hypothetical protein